VSRTSAIIPEVTLQMPWKPAGVQRIARRSGPGGKEHALGWINSELQMTKLQLQTTRQAMAIAVALAVAGCAVGPNFKRPEAPATSRFTPAPLPDQTAAAPAPGGAAQRFVSGADIPAQWWNVFHSDPLDGLIRDALKESPTLAAAQAALRQAQENVTAARGALLPGVDAQLGVQRSNTLSGFPGPAFTVYNASLNVSYKFDLFGGVRRQIEAAGAQADYQNYLLRAAWLTLTSNIVTTVVQEASLRGQIQATRDIIQAQEAQLKVIERQFELGGVSKPDVLAQRTQVAQTRATLPPQEKALAQTRHRLAVLTGKLPSEATLPEFEISSLNLPQELPVSLPSSLVRQRPDIRASEALLHAASAEVGVATANLYPQISLTASGGSLALKPGDLFTGPARAWSIGGGLLEPLFRGGTLNAQRRAAIAAYDQAEAQYKETVLQSFQEVADTLRALETDAVALKAQSDAEATAREALELTQRQYKLGAASYLTLLNAERQYQQSKIALVQASAARYADTAALFQALGGGWWNQPALADASATATTAATATPVR
jgi:NodT family efflux transporter outer membrane factor (OMF) lipoprotein